MTADDVIKRFNELGCLFTAENIGKYQSGFIPFAQDKGLIRWLYWEIGCMNCYQCKLCDAEPKTAWGGVLRHFKNYHPNEVKLLVNEVNSKLKSQQKILQNKENNYGSTN